jgi:sterol 14-demethylase
MDGIELPERQHFDAIPFLSGAKPSLGHFEEFVSTPIQFLHRAYEECGEVGEFDMGGLRTVLLVGPEAQEAFFRAPEDQLNVAAAYQMMVPVQGEGVQFGAPPDIERQQLRIQYQGLRYERMAGYAGVVAHEVEDFIREWGDEGEFDFYEGFTDLTLKTSTHCLLGPELRYRLTAEIRELYHHLEEGLDPSALLDPYTHKECFLKRDEAHARLREIVGDAIRERRASGATSNDMLQIYMDAQYDDGSKLSEKEITGMVIWFMFAGHHTSSNTATWTLLEICRNPQYQADLKDEIDRLYDNEKQLSVNAQRDIPLLEGFMRESLRIHPPLNTLTRRVLYDFNYKDYTIEAGKNVMVCPHVAHRLAEVFPDPEVFDPRRPAPGNQFATIAFGGGRHRCIGNAFALLQVRTIFCALLRDYDFALTQPLDSYRETMPTLILRPTLPCRVRYTRRTTR